MAAKSTSTTKNGEPDWKALAYEAGSVFSPTAPIDLRDLFAGRDKQVRLVLDAVNQKGQHAIIFGERGVGKTSLGNVISQFFNPTKAVLSPRVNCDSTDSFETVWRKVLEQIQLTRETTTGFGSTTKVYTSDQLAADVASPDAVRRILTLLSKNATPIIIVDEFDRLKQTPRRAFADTVKNLSDHAVLATVVLIGVADSVDDLIHEHQSVERALVQVQMPRMSRDEIWQIIKKGLERLTMSIDDDALEQMSILSRGLPHYTHLISLHAARAALDAKLLRVNNQAVTSAIEKAIEGAQHSIRSGWHEAIRSSRKDNLFSDVLLACALAEANELGFFAAQDVRKPIREITGRDYDIPNFAQHLNEFSSEKRGRILQKTGDKRRYRYRFSNPLMQPFVIMQGFSKGRLKALPQ